MGILTSRAAEDVLLLFLREPCWHKVLVVDLFPIIRVACDTQTHRHIDHKYTQTHRRTDTQTHRHRHTDTQTQTQAQTQAQT